MKASEWLPIFTLTTSQALKTICLENMVEVISSLWNTRDTTKLNGMADVTVNKVSQNAWPSTVASMAPFLLRMCENQNIQKIGIYCANTTVNLLVDPKSPEILEDVVSDYCRWQEENPDAPYFEVRTVSASTFASRENSYNIVVKPKR